MTEFTEQPQEVKEVPQETQEVAEARQELDRATLEPAAAVEKAAPDFQQAEQVESAFVEAVESTQLVESKAQDTAQVERQAANRQNSIPAEIASGEEEQSQADREFENREQLSAASLDSAPIQADGDRELPESEQLPETEIPGMPGSEIPDSEMPGSPGSDRHRMLDSDMPETLDSDMPGTLGFDLGTLGTEVIGESGAGTPGVSIADGSGTEGGDEPGLEIPPEEEGQADNEQGSNSAEIDTDQVEAAIKETLETGEAALPDADGGPETKDREGAADAATKDGGPRTEGDGGQTFEFNGEGQTETQTTGEQVQNLEAVQGTPAESVEAATLRPVEDTASPADEESAERGEAQLGDAPEETAAPTLGAEAADDDGQRAAASPQITGSGNPAASGLPVDESLKGDSQLEGDLNTSTIPFTDLVNQWRTDEVDAQSFQGPVELAQESIGDGTYLELQENMQHDNRQYTMISNVMKIKHDQGKVTINNVRGLEDDEADDETNPTSPDPGNEEPTLQVLEAGTITIADAHTPLIQEIEEGIEDGEHSGTESPDLQMAEAENTPSIQDDRGYSTTSEVRVEQIIDEALDPLPHSEEHNRLVDAYERIKRIENRLEDQKSVLEDLLANWEGGGTSYTLSILTLITDPDYQWHLEVSDVMISDPGQLEALISQYEQYIDHCHGTCIGINNTIAVYYPR